jgi:hypothetical protein
VLYGCVLTRAQLYYLNKGNHLHALLHWCMCRPNKLVWVATDDCAFLAKLDAEVGDVCLYGTLKGCVY